MTRSSSTFWVLTQTAFAGQCTGFSSETIPIAYFQTKPSLVQLAAVLGNRLPSDNMGQAISLVAKLLSTGEINRQYDGLPNNDQIQLDEAEFAKDLGKEHNW